MKDALTSWPETQAYPTSKVNSSCFPLRPLRPRTTPFLEERYIVGVIYGVLLLADMNAATPLGAWERSVISLDQGGKRLNDRPWTRDVF